MVSALLIIILIVSLLSIFRYDLIRRLFRFYRIVKFSRKLQGPSILEFAKNSSREKVLPFFVQCHERFGSRYGIWMGKDLVMFVTEPDDVKLLLSSQSHGLLYKSKIYEILRPWLGEGLLNAGGDKWQRSRKFLTPAFHFNILKQFQSTMNECGEVLVQKLKDKANCQVLNVYPFVTLFALDIISETAMGTKVNAQLNMESPYVEAVQGICQVLHYRSLNIFLRNDFTYHFSSLKREQDKWLQVLHGETNRVIDERRQMLLKMKSEEEQEQEEKEALVPDNHDSESKNVYLSTKRRFAFLDMLLMAQSEGKEISNVQIREEVDTFMFEGHDTTSSAISFALYLLSKSPDVQSVAHNEAVRFEGREHEPMKYLEAVIKETLRLFPSVPFYSRRLHEDHQFGDMLIPKGVAIVALPFAMHRDERIFNNAMQFKPERFLDEENLHPFAHVAFSAGPRNCIGQKFAMLEMKCVLAKLLRSFELHSAGIDPILISEIILKSKNGVHVKLVSRVK